MASIAYHFLQLCVKNIPVQYYKRDIFTFFSRKVYHPCTSLLVFQLNNQESTPNKPDWILQFLMSSRIRSHIKVD